MLKDIYLLKMIACISVRVLVRPQRQYIDSLYDAAGLIGPSRYDAAVDIVEKQASETLFSIRKWLDDCSAEQCIGGRDGVDRLAEKVREVTGRECRYNPSSNDL